ncbi:MAG: hypothetical protein HY791_02610 [Deltaproteobacteria bacterium]|nr:hypothetical protein [Deltaproteobacteria bacterium]
MRSEALLPMILMLGCGENLTPPETAEAARTTCYPNLDGRIDFEEFRLLLDHPASYFVSTEEQSIDVEGVVDDRGIRIWSYEEPGRDELASIRAVSVRDEWYSGSFPSEAFVLEEPGRTVDAVYLQDSTGLTALGYASREENPSAGKTLLVYQAPVMVHRYPLRRNDVFGGVGVVGVDGVLNGLPYAGQDTWEIEVAATGELGLPDVTLVGVYRLDISVSSQSDPPAGAPIVRRAVSFLFECLGEVVHFEGRAGGPSNQLGTVVSSRRLTLRR